MSLHLWLIPLLPALGAVINGLFGRRFPKAAVSTVALTSTALSFGWAVFAALQFVGGGAAAVTESHGAWIRAGSFSVEYGFYLDQLSMVMMLVVTGVGFLIHVYSVGYMAHEGGYYRFFSYLNLFMFFMLTLVLADNYLLMFVGWEGVGLASYLLIGFFFRRDSAANAGKKAFITNRVGDFGFLIALFLLIKHFNTLQYSGVFKAVNAMPVETAGAGLLTAIGLLMLFGATGKSAQIPLFVWLPDAMEGPTPVSALIHAATMVTAGVYVIARSNAVFNHAPIALMAVAVVGCLTAIFAATIGMAQNDIKRVLAYSTISQLGYMFLACGVAAYSAGIFHLMTHAFFKALLFLGAGSVIHALGGEQDMRRMGGLRHKIPYTYWTMTAATFTIAGFPFLSGFFSKDEILWQTFSSPHGHWVLWLVGVTTAFLTSFYMFRMWFMTFWGDYRGEAHETGEHAGHAHATPIGGHDTIAHAPATGSHGQGADGNSEPHESPWIMLAPLVILAVLSVVGGYVGVPHALGGNNTFHKFLAPVLPSTATVETGTLAEHVAGPAQESASHGESASHEEVAMERLLTGVSVAVAFAGFGLAWLLYVKRRDLPAKITASLGTVYKTVLNKYYVDEIYGASVIGPIVEGSTKLLWRGIDVGAIDATVNEAARGAQDVSDGVRQQQSGNIRSYAGWVAAGAALVIVYMVWMGTR
ncbi:MAG TPA: NADH-quinone oxidoreductase subunit L [Clostridia bacterium]|nr:NADH-quinone oxidoreductase subunit L [Clostridia bacterium]